MTLPDDPVLLAQPEVDSVPCGRKGEDGRLFLRALPFFARHGVHEAERELGQRFVIDVDWWLDTAPAAWADDERLTVSYQHVYEQVSAVMNDKPVRLVETLAERIALRLLDHFALITQVRVVVHKPGAPITGVFGDVGVEILRHR